MIQLAERARADRGQRFVENRQQRALARAVGRRDQLEMTPRGLVHQHVLGDAVETRRRDVREVVAEGVFDVEQRDSRRVRDRFVEVRVGVREAIRECRGRALGAERFVIERRQRTVQILQQRAQLAVLRGDYDFARRDARDFLAQRRGLANLRREKLAGRDVERRQREPGALRARDCDQVALLGRRQHHLLADGAGRDHAHDLPRHQLGRFGVGRALLADRDLVAGLQQLGDVRFRANGRARRTAARRPCCAR